MATAATATAPAIHSHHRQRQAPAHYITLSHSNSRIGEKSGRPRCRFSPATTCRSAATQTSDSRKGDVRVAHRRRDFAILTAISVVVPLHCSPAMVAASELSIIQSEVRNVLTKNKAPGVLRMAFHDAGTFDMDDHSGGMNGSIIYELERPENAGLTKTFKVLEKAKREIDKVLQDLIAVAGAEAVSLCEGPFIPVRTGRVDSRMPDPEGKLPEESLDASGLKSCFLKKGFSAQELVALSGAHTIGGKGFGNPVVFDNAYYRILLQKPWTSGEMSSMIGLPSDHALVEDDECLRWIRTYADDEAQFFDDFKNAYRKLVDSGAVWRAT